MKHSAENKKIYQNIIDGLELDNTKKAVLKSTWLDYLLLMDISANKGWFLNNYSQIAVIIFSLLIPIIEKSKLNLNIFQWDLSIVSVLGLTVAALATLNRQLGFAEKWNHFRMTAETMRNEGDDFFALTGNYKTFNTHEEAFKTFVSAVTSFKRQEVSTYLEEEKNRKKEDEKK
jgi:hypothetical protein